MRRFGLLHTELNRLIAAMGHTDMLVVADVGLPVPSGVACVDLAVLPGIPSFAQVFDAIIRTGERAPYPNAILHAGMTF